MGRPAISTSSRGGSRIQPLVTYVIGDSGRTFVVKEGLDPGVDPCRPRRSEVSMRPLLVYDQRWDIYEFRGRTDGRRRRRRFGNVDGGNWKSQRPRDTTLNS